MKFRKNKFGAIVVKKCTQSYLNFITEVHHSEMFMVFFSIGSSYIEENKEETTKTMIDIYKDERNELSKEFVNHLKTQNVDYLYDLFTYQQFYAQMAFARSIDNMTTYFKDVLSEVILKRPEILKSSDAEKLDFILGFNSMEDLKIALAEKKTEELFYKGIDKIEEFYTNKLGITLFKTKSDKKDFTIAIKQRNLIVHNRGRITKEFCKEFTDSKYKIGDFLVFTYEQVSKSNIWLGNYLAFLDIEISSKFKLNQVSNG
jgi:hypothetical protein